MKITNEYEKFFIVYNWMSPLFSGNISKRDVYAAVYNCWKNGDGCWHGSQKKLAELTGHSASKCNDYLKELVNENYLIRKDKNGFIFYYVNLDKLENIVPSRNCGDSSSEELKVVPSRNCNSSQKEQNNKYNNIKNKIDSLVDDFEHTLVVGETPSGGSEGSLETIASQRHNTKNNPYVILSDDEREQLREEMSKYGEDAYLATIQAFNRCNKNLIDDGLNPYAPGIEGFRRFVERYGVSTVRTDIIRARI